MRTEARSQRPEAGSVELRSTAVNGAARQVRPTLTHRQREVLAGIASGRAHKQVAAELGISYQTLCAHRKELYRRLGIHSQTEAVRAAIRMGMT